MIPSPSSVKVKIILISIGVLVKLLFSAYFITDRGYPNTPLEQISCIGDCHITYAPAAYRLLSEGVYTIYSNGAPYVGRIPGFESLLALLAFLSSDGEIPFITLVLLQSIVSGIAVFCLSYIAFRVFHRKSVFYVTYLIFLISLFNSIYDIYGMTESLGISLFIISFSILLSPNFLKSTFRQILVGVLLLYSVLLRQYLAPFYGLWLMYLALLVYRKHGSLNIRKLIVPTLFIVLPLILFEAWWIPRNLNLTGRFIPLVDGSLGGYTSDEAREDVFYISPGEVALWDYLKSWGGDVHCWNLESEITAFYSMPEISDSQRSAMLNSFPDYIYTDYYNKDSLKIIQESFAGKTFHIEDQNTINSLVAYRESFISEKPFHWMVVAPLRLLKKFLFHSGTFNLYKVSFSDLSLDKKLVKVSYMGLYIFVLTFGLMGVLILVLQGKLTAENSMIILSALFMIFLCPFVLRKVEWRYFVLSYPFLTILASWTAVWSVNRFNELRKKLE